MENRKRETGSANAANRKAEDRQHDRGTAVGARSCRCISLVLAVLAVSALAGCGANGGAVPLALCGNGRLDAGEQCDDGNLSDDDDCLSTCVVAVCGDTFIDSQGQMKEECDTFNLGGLTCPKLGFGPGTLTCAAGCMFDTSLCSPAPPTPTPTVSLPTPTPTATLPPTCTTLTATVSLVYDINNVPDLAALVVDLNYPLAASIPGSGNDESVQLRVTDLSGANGFSIIVDQDTNGDQTDDQLHNVYAAANNVPPGPFEAVVFDCASGMTPDPGAFSCSVSDTVDSQANPVEGVGCIVTVSAQ
jgi:cysteine-rich repeat protein